MAGGGDRSDQDAGEAIFYAAAVACLLLAALPGLVAGLGVAVLLRHLGCRWTFGLPIVVLGLIPLAVFGVGPLGSALDSTVNGGFSIDGGKVLTGLLPIWIAVIGPAAIGWMLWFDRRARLRGGERAARVEAARGPATLIKQRRDQKRAGVTPLTPGGDLWIGRNMDTMEVVRISPESVTHIYGPGSSGLGKTHDQMLFGDGVRALGWGRITFDPKGEPAYALRELEKTLAAGKCFQHLTLASVVHPRLQPHFRPFVVLGHGSATQAKDSWAYAQRWESDHYFSIVERGMQLVVDGQLAANLQPNLKRTARLLRATDRLAEGLSKIDPRRFEEQIEWLADLSQDERSALRGASNRCARMIEGDGARALLPPESGPQLDILGGLRRGDTIHLSIDCDAYPELGPQVIAFILGGLSVAASAIRDAGERTDALVCIDEAGALNGSQGKALIERCRSAGIRTWWAPQSANALGSIDPALHDAVVENSNLVMAHRQSVPEAAQLLADMAGTVEALEHTHMVSGQFMPIGFDEPGQRARRLTDAYQAHPNRIKNLGPGQVMLLEKGRGMRVQFVQVRGLDRVPAALGEMAA